MRVAIKSLAELIEQRRVVVVLGPGGVGKTTTAVGLALAAARTGQRVALISIDPAKRLAAAMGISLGAELKPVPLPSEYTGKLTACMLDQAAVFDMMVERYTSPERTARIFAIKIYHQASRNLGGPLEYMALAKLADVIQGDSMDLVVVDTPPDTHAIDFLVKPNVLAGFVEKRVMTWLIKPFHLARRVGFGRVLGFGERLMGGIAAVTGIKMLEMFSEFLVLMDEVIRGFHLAGQQVAAALRSDDAGCVLVMGPTPASLRSALALRDALRFEGFALDALLINRYPSAWQQQVGPELVAALKAEEPLMARLVQGLLRRQEFLAELLQSLSEARDAAIQPPLLLAIEEARALVHDIAGITAFSTALMAAKRPVVG